MNHLIIPATKNQKQYQNIANNHTKSKHLNKNMAYSLALQTLIELSVCHRTRLDTLGDSC